MSKVVQMMSFLFHVFFMNHIPQAHKTTLGSFQIFAKFADIFASQGAPPVTNLPPVCQLVSTTLVANCHMYQ